MDLRGEMMGVSISASNAVVVCPKPRRLEQILSSRCQINCGEEDMFESKSGSELIDIILCKRNNSTDQDGYMASSSPYFCGSPPNRTSNPLNQNSEFSTNMDFSPFISLSSISNAGSLCTRIKIGHKPATMRIEGFECLSHRISVVA